MSYWSFMFQLLGAYCQGGLTPWLQRQLCLGRIGSISGPEYTPWGLQCSQQGSNKCECRNYGFGRTLGCSGDFSRPITEGLCGPLALF